MDDFKFLPREKISQLPKTTGVYCFRGKKDILYIGKAINIRERVKNHFCQANFKDNLFISRVEKIGYIKTGSEFAEPSAHLTSHPASQGSTIEALLLEARLIKKHQPKYNVLWRDDKNYFYVAITKEECPRVFITHQPKQKLEIRNLKLEINYVGPFVEGAALKKTLKLLRKAFPYYTVRKHSKKECTWCHLKLCPGPSPDRKEYLGNIRRLINVLKGKSKTVLQNLKRDMKAASRSQDYEKAAKARDQISSLEKIISHARILEPVEAGNQQDWNAVQKKLQKILGTKKEVYRIEAYDISNIQGKEATGSMVVFTDGKPNKNLYRKFKIKIQGKPNDTAMVREILKRRLEHKEWPLPDLILVDGGKPQLNAAKEIVKKRIPLATLAKRKNELFLENRKIPILLKSLPREIFNLILQLRDEAHRFAISYHKRLREKSLLKS